MLPTMPMKHVNAPCITPASSSVPAIMPPVPSLTALRPAPLRIERGSSVKKDCIGAIVVPDAGNGGGRPMNKDIPAAVMNRLHSLQEVAENQAARLARNTYAIASARARLSGGFSKDAEYKDVRATLDDLLADQPILQKRVRQAQSVVTSCKSWLD